MTWLSFAAGYMAGVIALRWVMPKFLGKECLNESKEGTVLLLTVWPVVLLLLVIIALFRRIRAWIFGSEEE